MRRPNYQPPQSGSALPKTLGSKPARKVGACNFGPATCSNVLRYPPGARWGRSNRDHRNCNQSFHGDRSGAWWSAVGFRAHSLGNYELAVDAYEMSLKDKPNETWAL